MAGKLLECLILNRLVLNTEGADKQSDNQFGFSFAVACAGQFPKRQCVSVCDVHRDRHQSSNKVAKESPQ